jgi:hypothetical protein
MLSNRRPLPVAAIPPLEAGSGFHPIRQERYVSPWLLGVGVVGAHRLSGFRQFGEIVREVLCEIRDRIDDGPSNPDSCLACERLDPSPLGFSADCYGARTTRTAPLAPCREPHVPEASADQRPAFLVGERVGPCFTVTERRCSSAERAIYSPAIAAFVLANVLTGKSGNAADLNASSSLPDTRWIASSANGNGFAIALDSDRKHATLKLPQMTMVLCNERERGLDRNRTQQDSPAHNRYNSVRRMEWARRPWGSAAEPNDAGVRACPDVGR